MHALSPGSSTHSKGHLHSASHLARGVGAALEAATKAVYNSWGKGKYDPRFNIDDKSKPVVIPPAYGLQDIHRITFTGDGNDIAYWNRYVAVTQMGGLGTMVEPRLNLSITNGTVDLVSRKLPMWRST